MSAPTTSAAPAAAARGPRRDPLFTLNPHAISVAEGLRAGIAVALTVIAGALLNLPHFGLAALGALLTCFADPGGPVARRAPAVIAFAIIAGVAYGIFGLIDAGGIWIAAACAGAAIFFTSYARIYGQGGLQVGNLLSVVIVLALDTPAYSIAQAAERGLVFFTGAFWAVILTLVIWRIHPYGPARRAVAEVAQKLSLLARDLARLAHADESAADYEAHAALHRRGVREAIETARGVALQTFRRGGVISRRAAQLSVRLQTLEHVFSGLVALAEILENDAPARRPMVRAIRVIGHWLARLGPDIIADRVPDTPRQAAGLRRLRVEAAKLPESSELRHVLEAVAERLAVLVTAAAAPGEKLAEAQSGLPWRQRLFGPITANFNTRSAPLRHAARAAVTATPVLAWTLSRHQPFAHWAVITMVLCLQPYFSATWARAAERIAGTAFGGLLAAGIGLLAQTQLSLALAMLPLTVFAFAIRGVSYGLFTAALTPMIVLLVEQIAPGANEISIALSRIGYTLLGGTLAVVANALLWPGFESARVEASTAAAITAHAAYADAVFTALLAGVPAPDAPRRAAGLASNNLEATLSRAIMEPHRRRDPGIARGAVVDAALRRMAGRLSVLAFERPVITAQTRKLWQDWQHWLVQTLSTGAAPRPKLPEGVCAEALTRLARQAELIAE